ncbi:MAG: hypothetical protein KC503_31425 [Myxococcales bacterium]|nr:hypothetical protein [Myxococcales bacterium]
MRMLLLAAVCVVASACGAGEPPTISQLSLPQQAVTLGQQANGALQVSDPDGLGGMRLRLTFSGPATTATDVAVQGASDAITEAQVPFVFGLLGSAPVGTYTLEVVAIDGDDNTSNALSGTVEATN